MQQCIKCNKEIPTDSLFCNYCGKKQSKSVKKSKYYVRKDGLRETSKIIKGKRIYFRGRTDAEVEQKMIEYMGELTTGRMFETIADEWQAEHWDRIAVSTQRGYTKAFKRIREHFLETPIKNIRPANIEQLFHKLANEQFTIKTIRHHKLVCNLIFTYAVIAGDIDVNPCTYVTVRKGKPSTKREPPSPSDIEIVRNHADTSIGLMHLFVLYTGARRGEAMAIKYSDIDWEKGQLRISRSIYYDGATPMEKEPKTVAGIRTVPVLDILKAKLPHRTDHGFIFFPDGLPYKTTFERSLRKYRLETGLQSTLHQLRHGYATILYEAGIDEKLAQTLLGHASILMTKDIYTHVSKDKSQAAAKQLNEFIHADFLNPVQE